MMKPVPITSFVAVSFASAAFLLGALSVPWCDFATLTSTVVDSGGSTLLQTRLGFGLWRYQTLSIGDGGLYVENSCSEYDPTLVDVDGAWKAARAFGILALIIGGMNLLYSYRQVCRSEDGKTFNAATQARISGGIFIVASFYQGLTLFFLRSSICNTGSSGSEFQQRLGLSLQPAEIIYGERCTFSSGASMTIASSFFWFVAGVVLCCVDITKRRAYSPDGQEEAKIDGLVDDGEVDDKEKPSNSIDNVVICENEIENDGEDPGEQNAQTEQINECKLSLGLPDSSSNAMAVESQTPQINKTAEPPTKPHSKRRRYRS